MMNAQATVKALLTRKQQLEREVEILQRRLEDAQKMLGEKRRTLEELMRIERAGTVARRLSSEREVAPRRNTGLSAAILQVIPVLGKFSKRDLEVHLRKHFPDLRFEYRFLDYQVSKLVLSGTLKLVRQGGGGNPGIPNLYEIPGNQGGTS